MFNVYVAIKNHARCEEWSVIKFCSQNYTSKNCNPVMIHLRFLMMLTHTQQIGSLSCLMFFIGTFTITFNAACRLFKSTVPLVSPIENLIHNLAVRGQVAVNDCLVAIGNVSQVGIENLVQHHEKWLHLFKCYLEM